jgi:hypothetical protein
MTLPDGQGPHLDPDVSLALGERSGSSFGSSLYARCRESHFFSLLAQHHGGRGVVAPLGTGVTTLRP